MTSGYPPAVMEDLSVSVEEAVLKEALVVLKGSRGVSYIIDRSFKEKINERICG